MDLLVMKEKITMTGNKAVGIVSNGLGNTVTLMEQEVLT